MFSAKDLHEAIAQVCPIFGVSIGKRDDKKTWRIDYEPKATAEQRASAANVVQSYLPSELDSGE